MMAGGAAKKKVRTKKQAPAMTLVFIAGIVKAWGSSEVWWQRQVALMILLALSTIARGGEVISIPARGVTWVNRDGTHRRGRTPPHIHCFSPDCTVPFCIRGALILFPARKSKQVQATWVPVIDSIALALLANHMR